MLDTLTRYYRTIKFLKTRQIYAQIRFRLGTLLGTRNRLVIDTKEGGAILDLNLIPSISTCPSFIGNNTFSLLNLKVEFGRDIDWNYNRHGKLWCYNLNYFQFLLQEDFSEEDGLILINSWIDACSILQDGLEPYPTSIRIINWIKFLDKCGINDYRINDSLRSQLDMLSKNIEYHLLGNHLLENGFALFFGGVALDREEIFEVGEGIILAELTEQILGDGGHFESSPMYHSILLERLLDCINLIENKPRGDFENIRRILREVASKMIRWLSLITFENGNLACVNDASEGIGPSYSDLLNYADRLEIKHGSQNLLDSGYRKINNNGFELLIDVGDIGPDYIPGHGHCDCLSFILHHKSLPIMVDTGISTYENNKRRLWERSTAAHNTVSVDNVEQSEIWGSFRVGRRAKMEYITEGEYHIRASHDGYRHINGSHTRSFIWSESSIEIEDKVNCKLYAEAFFHFHPEVVISLSDGVATGAFGSIRFVGASEIKLSIYDFALGYNLLESAQMLVVKFNDQLTTKIILN